MPYIDKPLSKMRVLAADDNEVNRLFLEGILSPKVQKLLVVADGSDAISYGQQTHWDIILLDLHMPGADGVDVMQILHPLPSHQSNTLFIVITADARKSEQDRLLALGFHGFLTKPISGKALLEGINTINNRPGQAVTMASSAVTASTVLDDNAALAVLHNDRQMLSKIRLQFAATLPALLNQVTAALNHSDSSQQRQEIWDAAHKIAGGCAYAGANQLAQICNKIQNQIDTDASVETLLNDYLQLRKILEQTAVAIHLSEQADI